MIKFILFLFILNPWSASAARKSPTAQSGIESGIDLRIIKKWNRYVLLAEGKNRNELLNQNYQQYLIGGYYRLTKNLRTGLFIQAEQGLRWDDDWKKKAKWEWKNIQNRWDYSALYDVTYSNFLFKNTLWEWKNRIQFYHLWDAFLFKSRPGIRHFILKFGKPIWQLYSEIEVYIPLNYGKGGLYEYWLYNGALYQVTDEFSIGPVISYRQRWYHSYPRFESQTSQEYKETFSSLYLGLSAVYSF